MSLNNPICSNSTNLGNPNQLKSGTQRPKTRREPPYLTYYTTYFALKGTCIASRYSSVAILVASPTFRQSISQNLAETVVVKFTQSLTKCRGVEPVTSSHCALVVPPKKIINKIFVNFNCIFSKKQDIMGLQSKHSALLKMWNKKCAILWGKVTLVASKAKSNYFSMIFFFKRGEVFKKC